MAKEQKYFKKKKQGREDMIQKYAPRLQECLVILLNFCHIAVLFLIICSMFGIRHIQVFCLCVLAAFPFLLYLIRCKCAEFGRFLGMHLAALVIWGILLLLGSTSLTENVLSFIILLFYECFSFHLHGTEVAEKETVLHPAISVGLFAAAFFVQNIVKDTGLAPLLAGLTVAYLCLYFIHYYLENYLNFMKVNRAGGGNFQGRKLFRLGISAAGGYILFSAVVLAVCTNPTLGNWLGQGMKAFLRFLLAGLQKPGGGMEEAETLPNIEQLPMIEDNWEVGRLGILWEILDKVLEIFVSLLALAVLAALVIGAVKWIQGFMGKRHHVTILEGDSRIQDITESLDRSWEKKEKRRFLYGLSNNARIRKAYAGFVKSRKKTLTDRLKKELACSTARECVQSLILEETDVKDGEGQRDGAQMIQIYERARYSGKECGSADLQSFKQALNRIRRSKTLREESQNEEKSIC